MLTHRLVIPAVDRLQLLREWIVGARRDCGAGVPAQVLRYLSLRRQNPTLTLRSFYEHGLYDETLSLADHSIDFIGRRYTAVLSEALNPRGAVSVAWDKLLFEVYAHAFSVRSPETVGVYSPISRFPAHTEHQLSSSEEVRQFLERPEVYPVFMKPVHSQQGIGGYLLTAYDAKTRQVDVQREGQMSLDSLFSLTLNRESSFYQKEAGYLFQRVVAQHAALSELTGSDALSGMRIIALRDARGDAYVHRAVLKLIVGDNAQDNFRLGRSGNMVCNIDSETGELGPGITGPWPGARWLDEHPDTGRPIVGFQIPNWEKIAAEVCRATRLIGGMRICHWDVVCAEAGPVFLEVNDIGGIFLPQAAGKALFDDRLGSLLASHGRLKHAPALRKLLQRRGHLHAAQLR